jgi:hypothetical protein
MIRFEQAEQLHLELLYATTDEVVSAVLKLHAPVARGTGPWDWPACNGCVGTIQGDQPTWPDDCDTTQRIAPYLHVDIPK